jgi:hypothetical protein
MRFAAFSLILTVGFAVARGAAAQMGGQTMGSMGQGQMMSTQPGASAPFGGGSDQAKFPTQQERYAGRIMALKQKMQKLTAQDGGQLSDEHKAGLQRELDGLNKSFGIKPAQG